MTAIPTVGDVLSVDTAAMHRLAERIRAAAQVGLGPGERASLQPAVAALAAPGLAQAAGTFLERWGAALTELADDAVRLADTIDLVARTYQDVESVTDRGMLR